MVLNPAVDKKAILSPHSSKAVHRLGAWEVQMWPDWLKQKMEYGEQTQSREIGVMEMQ